MAMFSGGTPEEKALRDADKAYKRRVKVATDALAKAHEGELIGQYGSAKLYRDRLVSGKEEIALIPGTRAEVTATGTVTKTKDKTVDTRELYLTVEHDTAGLTIKCKPDDGERVRQFAQQTRLAASGGPEAAEARRRAVSAAQHELDRVKADRADVDQAESALDPDAAARVRRRHRFRWVKWTAAGFAALVILGVIFGRSDDGSPDPATTRAEQAAAATSESALSQPESEPEPEPIEVVDIVQDGKTVHGRSVKITGHVSHPGAKVKIDGHAARVSDRRFARQVPLSLGENEITVSATLAGESAETTAIVTRRRTAAELAAVRARRQAQRAAARQELINSAVTIPYNQLKKNADRYSGDLVKYTGQIFQIQESGDSTVILLSVTDEGYGFYDDNIWVNYDGHIAGAEDDIITVYGRIDGSRTYETQIGGETYVPEMTAEIVEE